MAISIRRLIQKLASDLNREVQHSISGLGLTAAQWNVLSAVAEQGATRPSEIAAIAGVDGAAVTRHLDRLIEAGFLVRELDPDDRRSLRILLTGAGADLAAQAGEAVRQVEANFLSALTPEEIDQLQSLISRLIAGTPPKPATDDWSVS